LKLLCVHGVGHQEGDPTFRPSWTQAITTAVHACDPAADVTIDFVTYDALFDHAPLNPVVYAAAFAKLLASAVVHSVGDAIAHTRGIGDVPELIKWTAGMIAQWATEDDLRKTTRTALLSALSAGSYDAVFGHSLGSLICYDTFVHEPSAIEGKVFVSLGSQIAHPGVRDVFAGRIQALDASKWYHLFNPYDHVLTCRIRLDASNFEQVITEFDKPNDPLNHDVTWYLGHANTIATVWRDLCAGPQPRALVNVARAFKTASAKPTRRALLIGINDYPDPANRLDGCVNDVFLMSSILQECRFTPDEIRVVLNERATTRGIMDRLHWLLDGVRDGDQRFLFYSGHGAQIPVYGSTDEPDHNDECLVPYDFDWSVEHAILDSQLPYASHFVAVFDCCHSGGMTRDGGPRVRGLTPPDDIRHRALAWNAAEQMWVPRDFAPANRSLADSKARRPYVGSDGATHRLGRAISLRTLPNAKYDAVRTTLGHHGPYLPILMEACRENQLSYEYRHGATSYGAYTFCLGQSLRERVARGTPPTFTQLNALVGQKLTRLEYDQEPVLVGARRSVGERIPWLRAAASKTQRGSSRQRSVR
jgi:metacaspase-1